MKIFLLPLLLLTLSLSLFGQTPAPTPVLYSDKTVAEMKRLQQAAVSSDYAYREVGYLANNIGPRLSGSAQADRAVQYVAEQMRKLGLEVRLQPCMVPHWVRGAEHGELIEWDGMATGTTQKVVLTALGGSVATPDAGLAAEIVVVNNFEEIGRASCRERVCYPV